jgi:hypothetical protein
MTEDRGDASAPSARGRMPTARALAVLAAACLALIGVMAAIALSGRLGDGCVMETLARVASPDRRFDAVAVAVACGGSSDFTTQVSVLRAGKPVPHRRGNALVADGDHGEAPSGPGGGPVVELRWTGPRALTVGYDRRARASRTASRVRGVRITYARF